MLGILRRVMRGVRVLLELRMLVERITFMGGFGPWMLEMNFYFGYWDKVVIRNRRYCHETGACIPESLTKRIVQSTAGFIHLIQNYTLTSILFPRTSTSAQPSVTLNLR